MKVEPHGAPRQHAQPSINLAPPPVNAFTLQEPGSSVWLPPGPNRRTGSHRERRLPQSQAGELRTLGTNVTRLSSFKGAAIAQSRDAKSRCRDPLLKPGRMD